MEAPKTDNQLFVDWIGSWPYGEYKAKRRELLDTCMMTPHRFNNLRRSQVALSPLEKREINKLAGVEIFKL